MCAEASRAHYAVASLRKTLPLPDGGIVWSPRGLPLPPEPPLTASHAAATLDRLSAMVLRARYFDGHVVAKEGFRARAIAGEQHIAAGAPSGIAPVSRSMLPSLPVRVWRERRRANFDRLLSLLPNAANARALLPGPRMVPFALTLVFDTHAQRDAARRALIESHVYPAVLWSLDDAKVHGIPREHLDLSRRILSLHYDQRYDDDDMVRVAELVRPWLAT